MSGSPLRRLALSTLLPAFHGHQPPAWALRLVEEGLGGYTLFGYNIRDAAQVSALTATLRAVRPDVVIATDEEGGDVTRLHYADGSPYPGNAALGVVDDVALTESVYRAIGVRLAAVGITLDMAPAVDVNSADDNPAIGTRSFGADPARVAAHGAAAVAGLQSAGVAACAKHFPGHGATVTDSHLDLPLVEAPLATLRERELPPFAAAIAAGARSVMTAHIRVPELTGAEPATFSRRTLRDLLRDELGFTGAVVSDALEMRGASGAIGIPEAAVRALAAGNDLLCFGGELAKSPDAEAVVEKTVAAIIAAVVDGRLTEDDLAASAARNAMLGAPAAPVPVGGYDDALGLVAARRAVRVEGPLPAGLAGAVVVQLMPPATAAVGEVPWGLAPVLPGVHPVADTAVVADLVSLAGDRPLVVASRDTHRHPWARALVESLAAAHPGVVLVEMGWPAAWRPAGAGYVATFGAAPVNARAAAEILHLC
ncbi:glycoside hydrolase family 3 protein [Luedemannella helvata]|uniref:Glycoside hydrolase family 3 protein n=1 Tax=Luedemannella helvata TaxID=349315 RepID=A0ABP4WBX7_9ACTN